MQRMTFSKACFRAQIIGYFGEEQDWLKQPLALRIVDWVFSDRNRKPDRSLCCDICDGRGRMKPKTEVQFICEALGTNVRRIESMEGQVGRCLTR